METSNRFFGIDQGCKLISLEEDILIPCRDRLVEEFALLGYSLGEDILSLVEREGLALFRYRKVSWLCYNNNNPLIAKYCL